MNGQRVAYLLAEGFAVHAYAWMEEGGPLVVEMEAGTFGPGFVFTSKEKVGLWEVPGVPFQQEAFQAAATDVLATAGVEWADQFATKDGNAFTCLFVAVALTEPAEGGA